MRQPWSKKALNAFGPLLPEFLGGSADLTPSDNTFFSVVANTSMIIMVVKKISQEITFHTVYESSE